MDRSKLIYAVSCVLLAGAFLVTNSSSALAALAIALIVPAASVAAAHILAPRVELSFRHKPACAVGDSMEMEASISRPPLFRGRVELSFSVSNALTGVASTVSTTLFPVLGKEERSTLLLDAEWCGAVSVKLISAKMFDSLGFTSVALPAASYESSYIVHPRIAEVDVRVLHSEARDLSSSSFDAHRAGTDRTEVFNIREFAESDSLKAVHWKVSARFDELMVREASRPTGLDLEIMCGVVAGDDFAEGVNGALSMLASVSLSLLRQGIYHCVVLFEKGAALRIPVATRANFDAMLDTLSAIPLPSEAEIRSAFSVGSRPFAAKTIIVCDSAPNDSTDCLAAATDLSILVVGGGDARMSSSSIKSYRLTSVPSAGMFESVKSLEL